MGRLRRYLHPATFEVVEVPDTALPLRPSRGRALCARVCLVLLVSLAVLALVGLAVLVAALLSP